jgi:thymidine kinase
VRSKVLGCVGRIEVICGCMFSGKTEELLRRLRRADIAGLEYLLCKPVQDTRTNGGVATHAGNEMEAYSILSGFQIAGVKDLDAVDIVAIDEAQFLDEISVGVVQELADSGKRIIIAGLDLDYLGNPFGPMPNFLAIAESVTKLQAVCTVCGEDACRTQRLTDSEDLVDIGSGEKYDARCREHFNPPHADEVEEERTQWMPSS